jgi:hypothetical protein
LDPNNQKAYYRSIKALENLDRIEEAVNCCSVGISRGMQFEKELTELNHKAAKKVTEVQKKTDAANAALKHEKHIQETLKRRNYLLSTSTVQVQHPYGPPPIIKLENGCMSFPVLFLYPEFSQSDYIAEFKETDTFFSHFVELFSEPAPFDPQHRYKPENIALFLENGSQLISVQKVPSKYTNAAEKYVHLTLADVLSSRLMPIVNQTCTFVLKTLS